MGIFPKISKYLKLGIFCYFLSYQNQKYSNQNQKNAIRKQENQVGHQA